MILFADSGSTKTEWILVKNKKIISQFETIGMNPFFISENEILKELENSIIKETLSKIKELKFYGAGCSTKKKAYWLKNIFSKIFISALINIKTDIEGAVLAVTNHGEKSIVSILGTGSAFRVFDGTKIIKRYSSLGYIIGDEGSGTHVSKALLRKIFYRQLSPRLEKAFFEMFPFSREEIIENVYNKPFPNKFLAQFTIFCSKYIEEEEIELLVSLSFYSFFQNHISQVKNYKDYKIHFVGSIAYHFKKQLIDMAHDFDANMGLVVQKPLQHLINKKYDF